MKDVVNCIGDKGKISTKALRDYISDNIRNRDLILKFKKSDVMFLDTDIAYLAKLADENASYVKGLVNYIIKEEDLSCDSLDALCKIINSVSEFNFKLQNLYELDNIRAGKHFRLVNINISDFMRSFYKSVNSYLPVRNCKNIGYVDTIRKDTFCNINLNLVTHILMNFISNAIKHSKSKDERIDIVLNRLNKGNYAAISVIDYGVGVDLDKIYEAVRLAARESSVGSMRKFRGYGLYVCQVLADKLGGSILVTNMKDGGAVFTLILEAKDAPAVNGIINVSDVESVRNKQHEKLIETAMSQFRNDAEYLMRKGLINNDNNI